MATGDKMRFEKFGRSVHLQILSAADCQVATKLDPALWVASGAPVATVNCDATFLKLVDSDNDGRILCWEMSDAIGWAREVLADHSGIDKGSDSLTISAVNGDCPDGARVGEAMGKMLTQLDRPEDRPVTLAEVRQFISAVEATSVSAAGVVLPSSEQADDVRQFLTDVVVAMGGAAHPSGADGVDAAKLEAFLAAGQAGLDWLARGTRPSDGSSGIHPLGEATGEAHDIYRALRAKIEKYFSQCQAIRLDERLAGRMGLTDEELTALDMDDPAVIEEVLAGAPIAVARPDSLLHYDEPTNPRDAGRLTDFRRLVAGPLLDDDGATLSYGQFRRIRAAFAERDAWLADKPADSVLALGADKLTAYADERFAKAAQALIAESSETTLVLENIRLVEKAILYQANILALANNFVSFPDLYDPDKRAMFEVGTLVMDGRRFNLAVRVTNRAEHAKIARGSNMFLMYVEVTPPAPHAKHEVAVPVTAGGRGNLCAGKRGVFRGLDGKECDARIVEIVENPISVAEALVSPFVRVGKMLSGKIESITASADKKFDTQASAAINKVSAPQPPAGAPAAAPASKFASGGMLMGAGVALAVVGTALAYIAEKLTKLHWYEIWLGIGGVMVAVLLPTFILAWLKLRKRDLSAILEGSGWAINPRMRLTRKQCRIFTERPRRPRGATLIGSRKKQRIVIAVLVILGLALAGWFIVGRIIDSRKPVEQTQTIETPPADNTEDPAEQDADPPAEPAVTPEPAPSPPTPPAEPTN